MGPNEAQEDGGGWQELVVWIGGFFLLAIAIPVLVIFVVLPPDLRGEGLAILLSVPIIEYLAIGVGVGLDIDPVISFLLTVLPCIGICMLIMGLLGHMGDKSQRVKGFQGRVQARMDKYPKLKRYGVMSNSIFVIITGVYIGSGIAWFLGWPRYQSLIMMALGIVSITVLIGLGTMGVINLFFV